MKRLGQTLSDDEINLMITEADTDGDKQVNYKGMLYHEDLSHKIFNSISISLF
jgi:Ca2+-binding EF-hand superfamily protein